MNRYPFWLNALVVLALLLGALYTIPNFYGETPAVQVSGVSSGLKADQILLNRVQGILKDANIPALNFALEKDNVIVKFAGTDAQIKARDLIDKALVEGSPPRNPYTVALNMLPNTPRWMQSIRALPMYRGLDLRGGVHLLMQVDMKEAMEKKLESLRIDVRRRLREQSIYYSGQIQRQGERLIVRFSDPAMRAKALAEVTRMAPDYTVREEGEGSDLRVVATLKPEAATKAREDAIARNIATLHNRVNELGTAEPIIQQQGQDRIVVELPGVQDPARVKAIIGRTASLEVRMVDEQNQQAADNGDVPVGSELVNERAERGGSGKVLVKREVVLTGESIVDAYQDRDEFNRPAVGITLDSKGASIFRDVTRENVGKRMAILLLDKEGAESITSPTIQEEIGGGRVRITGMRSPEEARDVAVLLGAGALAARMDFVEERTVGPSLGEENIAKGFNSVLWGFAAIAVFMVVYYMLFGMVSVLALGANLLFLVALLSVLQTTLTLPGMAGIALTLGMAIDANVLINERIREELRNGVSPHAAINAGYDRAFGTILDSNVTTFIAGMALFAFGSGPVRGFAVVLCLGILTSMFSAVVVSRAIVNWIYGGKRKIEKLAIGNTSWTREPA
jgi:preprotein translocase subunit SecD